MRIGRRNGRNVTGLKGNMRLVCEASGGVKILQPRRVDAAAAEGRGCLPDAAGVFRVHRLTLVAAECLAELVEVLDRAVDAPAAG